MKLSLCYDIFIIIFIILVFVFIYVQLFNSKPVPFYEGLQNMDASFLYHDTTDAFSSKLIDSNDIDLSGMLQDNFYNTSLFNTYKTDDIDLDVKYFNNISHVLMMYDLRDVLP